MLILIFLFVVLPFVQQIEAVNRQKQQNALEDVQRFSAELSAMMMMTSDTTDEPSPTNDVVDNLKLISRRASNFARFIASIGSLIVAGTERRQTFMDPDSDDSKAINELREFIIDTMRFFERDVNNRPKAREHRESEEDDDAEGHHADLSMLLSTYDLKVTMALRNIELYFTRVMDKQPGIRGAYAGMFRAECAGPVSPRVGLSWLYNVLGPNACHLPNAEEDVVFARFAELFMQIEANFSLSTKIDNTFYYWSLKEEYQRRLLRMSASAAFERIDELKKRNRRNCCGSLHINN